MFNLVPDIISEYWQQHYRSEEKIERTNKPADEFKKFCDDEPWAPECKIFDV